MEKISQANMNQKTGGGGGGTKKNDGSGEFNYDIL
jgi:hypothetical protein